MLGGAPLLAAIRCTGSGRSRICALVGAARGRTLVLTPRPGQLFGQAIAARVTEHLRDRSGEVWDTGRERTLEGGEQYQYSLGLRVWVAVEPYEECAESMRGAESQDCTRREGRVAMHVRLQGMCIKGALQGADVTYPFFPPQRVCFKRADSHDDEEEK